MSVPARRFVVDLRAAEDVMTANDHPAVPPTVEASAPVQPVAPPGPVDAGPPQGAPVHLPPPPEFQHELIAPPAPASRVVPAPPSSGPVLAPYGSRALAFLIDNALLACATLVIGGMATTVLAAFIDFNNDAGFVLAILILTGLPFLVVRAVLDLCYSAPLTARSGEHNGQTLGKQWGNIRVVTLDGRPMSFGRAFLRDGVLRFGLFGVGGLMLLAIPTLLDVLWPIWDPRKQTLHDKLAGTVVVAE